MLVPKLLLGNAIVNETTVSYLIYAVKNQNITSGGEKLEFLKQARSQAGAWERARKEFVHFSYIAKGSLYETMTLLEIFRRIKRLSNDEYIQLESDAKEIASMIKGLINSISTKSENI